MAEDPDFVPDAPDQNISAPDPDFVPDTPNPNMAPAAAALKANLAATKIKPENSTAEKPNPVETHEAKGFVDDFLAGWGASSLGMVINKHTADTVLPEHADTAARILSMAGGFAGDMPAMLAGMMGGGAAGPIGASAGAFALPAALRQTLMDHYTKGDIKDFKDFYERASATFLTTLKSGTIGAVTGGAGMLAKGLVAGASPLVAAATVGGAEVSAMTTAGAVMDGHVPNYQDFVDNAILVGGMHLTSIPAGAITSRIAPKLMNIYAKTGIKPEEVLEHAKTDPTIQQDILSLNKEIPDTYKQVVKDEGGINPNPELAGRPEGTAKGLTEEALSSDRSEATQKILAQVGEKTPQQKPGMVSEFKSNWYKDYVDRLSPIADAMKQLGEDPESVPAQENAYKLARMADSYKGKTLFTIKKGNLDFNTLEQTGKSLDEILKPAKKDPKDFEAYLIAKRAIEKQGQGFKTGFDLEAAKQKVVEDEGKYGQAQKDFVKWNDNNLKYLKDSGRISDKDFENITAANKDYVSFARIIDPEMGGSSKKKVSSLKAFKGLAENQDLKIQSPLVSALENTEAIFKLAEKNRAALKLVDTAISKEGQDLLQLVENKKGAVGKNQFEVYRNGEREVWEAKDPNVAEAIKALDGNPVGQGVFMRLARSITAVKKIGITLTPDFIIKNFLRDQITAGVFSKEQGATLTQTFSAMGDIIKGRDVHYDFLKAGGPGASFLDLNDLYLKKGIYKLDQETNFMNSALNVLKRPLDFVEAAGSLAEEATRLAEFKRVTKGEKSGANVFEGGFASREVTVDFQRVGAKVAALNAITAFQNPAIQGLDRTVRAIKADPINTGLKAVASITVPSALLWWATHDDERIKQIPRWQKDLFWLIPTDRWDKVKPGAEIGIHPSLVRTNDKGEVEVNHGTVYRIPKPQELGIMFGSLMERTLETAFTDNPNALKGFNETLVNLITPSFVPDAVVPAVEQTFNKSLFTGNPLIPSSVENIIPQEQYTEYTTESAKQISKFLNLIPFSDKGNAPIASPIVIENYVKSWGGTMGSYALKIADTALEKTGVVEEKQRPTDSGADIPFVKSFVARYPSAGAQSIQDFYDIYNEHAKLANTITHLKSVGNFDRISELVKDPANVERLINLSGIKESLAKQGRMARLIYDNKDYSKDDKRMLIDKVYYGMIETAKMGNQLAQAIKQKEK